MYIDTHCHLTLSPIYNKLEEVLKNCNVNNVESIISVATNLDTSTKSLAIASHHDNIYSTLGIHPNETDYELNNLKKIFDLRNKNKKVIGVGETGLDFYYEKSKRSNQIESFEKHIEFARTNNLPVIVHTRNAQEDTCNIIKKEISKFNTKFLIHCFSEDIIFCRKLIDMGCFISFSGIITFKNAIDLEEVVKKIPLNQLFIETDAPYLSPEPLRGKTNFPYNIKFVYEKIANIKNLKISYLCEIIKLNFKSFFVV